MIRYRGYYQDTETGLYYLQSRYYDPTTMRFINTDDPNIIQMGVEEKQELNLYAYCVNDPVNYIDINGLWPSATYTKRNNFISLVIKVPWKDIVTYFNFVSGVYAVIGIIACFIPEPTVSKAIGAAFGISSLILTIISNVLAEKKLVNL